MFRNIYTNITEVNLKYANLSNQQLHPTSNKEKKYYR